MSEITKNQERYIVEHINDRPRTKVAQAIGISMTSLYKYIRRHGGKMDYSISRRNPEWERIVRENYATMSGHEIERKFGIPINRANTIAHSLGLSHSEETKARLKEECRQRMRKNRRKLDYKALMAKMKAQRRKDEMRIWEGKKPLHNYKLKSMPTKAYKAKWHLMKNYGYFEVGTDAFTLGYDTDTSRVINRACEHAKFNEDYYSRRYGLKFVAV